METSATTKDESGRQEHPPVQTSALLQIPRISQASLSHEYAQWRIHYYAEFQDTFCENGSIRENVERSVVNILKANHQQKFRLQVCLNGVQLLLGIIPKENLIVVCNPGCRREFYLLSTLEDHVDLLNDAQLKERFINFKMHVDKLSSAKTKNFPTAIDLITQQYNLYPMVSNADILEIENRAEEISKKLMHFLNDYKPGLFERMSDFGLNLTANFALIRVHLLKFFAILPSLDHDHKGVEVKRIFLETLRRLVDDSQRAKANAKKGQERALPGSYIWPCKMTIWICRYIPSLILAHIIRTSVKLMAKRFIAGEKIETASKSLESLMRTGRDATLDQLGELVVSKKEADEYCDKVIQLIKGYSLHVQKGERNKAGINRAHISIKVSALSNDFKPASFDFSYNSVASRLKKILIEAKKAQVFINIDAEHYHYRDMVFKVYKKVLLETPELKNYKATGIVVQCYLRDAYEHLLEIKKLAQDRKLTMPIRLVKGAYWDAETIEAQVHGIDAPQFINKEESDIHFRQLILKTMEFYPDLQLCVAGHNIGDHCFAQAARALHYPNIPEIEHQCLHMTYEALSNAMAKMDWSVRNYVPIGSLLVGMAYLVRRIMENSSQVGFLNIMRSHKKMNELPRPGQLLRDKKMKGELAYDPSVIKLGHEFANTAPLRTYKEEELSVIHQALNNFSQSALGQNYKNSFNVNGVKKQIFSNSNPEQLVGTIQFANSNDSLQAIQMSHHEFMSGRWSSCRYLERASVLLAVADQLLHQRCDLSALICYEAGKSVEEALADVDEAIDFLNFYANEEKRLVEDNPDLIARGVTAVITPWNFPLAIPCGMVSAALVAGNTVIFKSAEQTPLIAQKLVNIFHQCGVPENTLIHLPGDGEEVGAPLVKHQLVSSIVFTGSKAVGTWMASEAGGRLYQNPKTKQKYPVKVVTEMGGKNAIIVTASAELDETVSGVLYSAFGHAGQKCSACSRILVDKSVKKAFLERFQQACQDIHIGKAYDFSTYINPLVGEYEKRNLIAKSREAIEEAHGHGGVVHIDRAEEPLPGQCMGPVVIELPAYRAKSRDSFAQRELFGPVVHIVEFDGLDQAVEIFNSTQYALTGGVFAQSQDDIDYLLDRLQCGNLYVNRSCTGARVAIEPFGGFKLSGTGPKAGGRNYVSNFHVDPNTMTQSQLSLDAGSDYAFDLCGPSGLGVQSRLVRINRGLGKIIQTYENIFGGVYEKDKKTLSQFKHWLYYNFSDYIGLLHPNRRIPGQLSFDDFKMFKDKGLLVTNTSYPDIKTLLNFFSAVAVGSGVTVIARSESSYQVWSVLVNTLHLAGFSKENVDVFLSSEKQLLNVCENDYFDFVICDLDDDYLQQWLPTFYGRTRYTMLSVHTPQDSPHISRHKRFLKQFIIIRSLAINTMRHGAPLELSL